MEDADNDDDSSSSDPLEVAQSGQLQQDNGIPNCEEEDIQTMSLAERIKRSEQAGVNLKEKRKRRAEAVKKANERLASSHTAKPKKSSKHAPTEASSKRQDFYRRKPQLNESGIGIEIGAHRFKPKDPRISSLSGHLNIEQFEKNYAFIQEIREKEIATMKQRIAARKVTGRKGQKLRQRLGITQEGTLEMDKEELKRLQIEKAEFERNQIERQAKQTVKKKLQKEVAQGQRGVYYPKRKELKRMEMEAKFEEMRKRGGDSAIQKAIAKRRKKNKSRDAGLFGGKAM